MMIFKSLTRLTLYALLTHTAVLALTLAVGHGLVGSGDLHFLSNRDGTMTLYGMDVDRGLIYKVLRPLPQQLPYATSPNNHLRAFIAILNGKRDIFVSDGQSIRDLTPISGSNEAPAWSPDSQWIAFTSLQNGSRDIYAVKVDAPKPEPRPLTHNAIDEDNPVWSPDGSQLAYMTYVNGNWDIALMVSSGDHAHVLTNHPATDRTPLWSPDGHHIAFSSNRDGNWEIYLMDVDGQHVRRLTDNPAWDGNVTWQS